MIKTAMLRAFMSHRALLQQAVASALLDKDSYPIDLKTDASLEALNEAVVTFESIANFYFDKIASLESTYQIPSICKECGLALEDLGLTEDTLSTEGLGTTLKKVMDAIIRAFGRFVELLRSFFEAVFGDISQMHMLLNDTKVRLNVKVGALPKQGMIPIGHNLAFLSSDRGSPTTARNIQRDMIELATVMKAVRKIYLPDVANAGTLFARVLTNMDDSAADQYTAVVAKLNEIFDAVRFKDTTGMFGRLSKFSSPDYPPGATFISPPLLGMRSMIFVDGIKLKANEYASSDPVAKSAAIKMNSLNFVRAFPNKKLDDGVHLIEAMIPSSVEDFLIVINNFLTEIQKSYDSPVRKSARMTSQLVQRHLNRLQGLSNANDLPLYAIVQYCQTYINWAKHPYVEMLSHSLNVTRASIMHARRHIANL